MQPSNSPPEAIALLSSDEEEYDKVSYRHTKPTTSSFLRLFNCALPYLLFIDLLTIVIIAYMTLPSPYASSTLPSPSSELPIRNPYVGLAELYASGHVNATQPRQPILNMPRIAAHVSEREPKKVFPHDEHRWTHPKVGGLSPPDRRTWLSAEKKIKTVYQFRVVDFGMEKCALAFKLPESSTPASVEIRTLHADRMLDVRSLSWSTRPLFEDQGRLGETGKGKEVHLEPGKEVVLEQFECAWAELLTFQVGCESCEVDVWAVQGKVLGMYMYQYQTV